MVVQKGEEGPSRKVSWGPKREGQTLKGRLYRAGLEM